MSAVFDIVFAGGGTTACVIAARLAAANPSLNILIVESGSHSRDCPIHAHPCRHPEHLKPNSTTISFHVGKPSAHLDGRVPVVPCGRAVGGGSAVNLMLYVRGPRSDYDDWKALGNEGWGFDEVLPLFKKFETFTPISERHTHGYRGPMLVSSHRTELGVGSQFLDVAKAYDPVRPQVDDVNDFKTTNAYSPSYRYIDPLTGKRCDAASQYLYPQSANPNVKIEVGKRVKRVVIENGRAVGIEYIAAGGGGLVKAMASRMVVVSAGAFGSPSILERSGIGSPDVLERHGVPVHVDLPGVGENYQDHFGTCPVYYASDGIETLDNFWGANMTEAQLEEWEKVGKTSHNGIEALAKLRLTSAELASTGPAFQRRWETFFKPNPDKPMAMVLAFTGYPWAPTGKSLSTMYYPLYPDLNGYVHITSGEDANSPLDFDPDFLSKACDVELLTLLYKITRERMRRMPAYRGEIPAYHPKFPPGSAAACQRRDGPVPMDAPDIMYSDADDKAIAQFHRDKITSTAHSLGTCAMRPRDKRGVVDSRLNVYGMEGLKVADLSICPTNVGNNTCSTALMIGEKAAIIVAEDLGVKLVE